MIFTTFQVIDIFCKCFIILNNMSYNDRETVFRWYKTQKMADLAGEFLAL